ncbi:hypothetical protein BJX61DRAFT_541193 [Aspergillus egyptiacus]|nr:hypothetical protein BJX61DRAFT_541193 [Aspergillus egyptiacus]
MKASFSLSTILIPLFVVAGLAAPVPETDVNANANSNGPVPRQLQGSNLVGALGKGGPLKEVIDGVSVLGGKEGGK